MGYQYFFEEQIKTLQKNIKSSQATALILLAVGILISVCMLVFFKAFESRLSEFYKLGPAVVLSGISLVPIKDNGVNRERIVAYAALKREYEQFHTLPKERQEYLTKTSDEIIREISRR